MAADTTARSETRGQIIKLARFAIFGTFGLTLLLLIADFLGRGWNNEVFRFLSENVLTAIVCAVVIETVVAIAALVCLALWKE